MYIWTKHYVFTKPKVYKRVNNIILEIKNNFSIQNTQMTFIVDCTLVYIIYTGPCKAFKLKFSSTSFFIRQNRLFSNHFLIFQLELTFHIILYGFRCTYTFPINRKLTNFNPAPYFIFNFLSFFIESWLSVKKHSSMPIREACWSHLVLIIRLTTSPSEIHQVDESNRCSRRSRSAIARLSIIDSSLLPFSLHISTANVNDTS